MTNVRTIHVDWYSQRPPRFSGGPQLAYQGDHLSNMVVFDNAPELPNYYLLVEMKTDEAGPVVALPDILLEGPYWVIPNYYTQICQRITYQVCCKTGSGDYEHHSAKFQGTILPVITHNGEPVDLSPMFDSYIDILDKRVNELALAAGDIQIDSELKSDSTNPVQNKVVKAAIDEFEENITAVNGRLGNVEDDLTRLDKDDNLQSLWEVGGLGSNGEKYDQRNTSIRTKSHLIIDKYERFVTTSNFSTGYICLYTEANVFIVRKEIAPSATYTVASLLASYPTAKRVQIEVGNVSGDVSHYNYVALMMFPCSPRNIAETNERLSFISDESAIDFVAGNFNVDGGADTPKIIQNAKYVSITFPCQTGRTYTVTREYGNRFWIVCTSEEPASRVTCETVVEDSALNSYTFIPPVGAAYVVVVLQNDYGDTKHTHEEIISSCVAYAHSALDYGARAEIDDTKAELSKALGQLTVDANKSDYWAIMGLGSSGENYTARNWNISTDVYLSNIISVTTDDGYATRYVLYNSNKGFIYRSGFSTEEIDILSLMKERSATYVRFEVQALNESDVEITTPIDNVSRYAHVHLYAVQGGIKTAGASDKWDEDSIVQSTYLDRIKQAKYVYASTDSGVSSHPVLTLLHFSDVHNNMNAMRYALDINGMFESDIDDMLHTGDIVTANLSDGISNWVSSGCANKGLNVIGNHDTEENFVLQAAGKDNVYNTIFAPYIAQWGVTQPTGVDTSGSDNYHALYYYKDYSAAEVRLIVLDTNFWDEAQKSWLTSVLADAKTNGMCVVIACHNVKLLTEMTDSNFSSYKGDGITETSNAYANQPADWLDPVNDFINDGGNFACILAGHNHDGHMGTMTNYPNIFVYVSDKASVARVSGAARITGEMNANAVSIVVINPVEKLFKIVKIGAQIDGKMRPQNVFCYDYANKQIVAQW